MLNLLTRHCASYFYKVKQQPEIKNNQAGLVHFYAVISDSTGFFLALLTCLKKLVSL